MFNITNPSYSIDTAQMWYEDWKHELEYSNSLLTFSHHRNGTDFIVICDEMNEPHYTKAELKAMKKDCLIDMACDNGVYINDCYTKAEIIDEIYNSVDNECYYRHLYENTQWRDLPYDFIARGHSQGEAVKVINNSKQYAYYDKEAIENLFYNTPIFAGIIEFLDQEIYLDDYVDSCYNWNKETLLSNFKERYKGWYKQRLIEVIKSLPDPEY